MVDRSQEELLSEALAGRLQVSITLENLLAWKATQKQMPPVSTPVTAPIVGVATGGLTLVIGHWTAIPPFSHMWPDKWVEPYAEAYQAAVHVDGRSRIIVIGLGQRRAAGMPDRARAVVFYQSPPKERALVEFSGNGTLQTATRYACPIKPRGLHTQLRSGDSIPEEYVGMEIEIFSSVIQGPYAANSLAVVAETEDRDTMLNVMARHGVIRGVYKGWL